MKLIPQGLRLLVRLEKVAMYKTDGGVWVPEKNSQTTRVGTVLAVGDMVGDRWKKDDLFLCRYDAGEVLDSPHLKDFKSEQDTLRMIVVEDIYARIEDDEEG